VGLGVAETYALNSARPFADKTRCTFATNCAFAVGGCASGGGGCASGGGGWTCAVDGCAFAVGGSAFTVGGCAGRANRRRQKRNRSRRRRNRPRNHGGGAECAVRTARTGRYRPPRSRRRRERNCGSVGSGDGRRRLPRPPLQLSQRKTPPMYESCSRIYRSRPTGRRGQCSLGTSFVRPRREVTSTPSCISRRRTVMGRVLKPLSRTNRRDVPKPLREHQPYRSAQHAADEPRE